MTGSAEREAFASSSCLVADDHPAVLRAVCEYLEEEGFEIAARAVDGAEALDKLTRMQPPLAVLDISMPKMTGIEVAREAASAAPNTAIILYTGVGDEADLVEAVDIGVRGFVLKGAPLDDLVRAILVVQNGGTYVDAVLGGALASGHATGRLTALTDRERSILRLLADGKEYKHIAEELFISPETVRAHVQHAVERLHADNRTQAVALAIRQSLIK